MRGRGRGVAKRDYPTIRVERTQLVWPSKFDQAGNVRPVEKTILPFQVVETVNESKADREASLLFRQRGEEPEGWRNRLIWGDNKVIMSSLLPELAGKIDLIYIDPPFATGQDFSFRTQVGDEKIVKQPSIIEEKAYRDTWGKGDDSYLQMMYDRLLLMHHLLAENGSLFVHLDRRKGPEIKLVLDEIFGPERFVNEIVWCYTGPSSPGMKAFASKHDTIYWYARGENWTFNVDEMRLPYAESTMRNVGRRTGWTTGRPDSVVELNPKGKYPEDWWRLHVVAPASSERNEYDTQKPESLLERTLKAASNPGQIVADFFCGSGTTGIVAEKLGRRWIMADLSKWAIQVTRKRLLGIDGCRPFQILNLGNYQRHKLAANGRSGPIRYVRFILDLYRGEFQTGFRMLHGKKGRAMVHVGSVDSPITLREIREALAEAKEMGVREVHFLGWDFEMGLHDLVDQVGEEFAVKVRLVSIPRESLEVTDPAKEHLRFFDLNYLDVAAAAKGRKATVAIKDFVIANPEYLPEEVREGLKKFSDTIDYWAVDWDYKGDTFHNGWQDFRTRKKRSLKTEANHEYEKKGAYRILVKVVDVFGNDTTKVLEVKVK